MVVHMLFLLKCFLSIKHVINLIVTKSLPLLPASRQKKNKQMKLKFLNLKLFLIVPFKRPWCTESFTLDFFKTLKVVKVALEENLWP